MRHYAVWVLASLIVAQGCAKEEVVYPPATIDVLKDAGLPYAGEAPAEGRLTDDAALVDPVMRVSSRLIAAARRSAYAPHARRARAMCWTIAVYDDPALRAFVRSDGLIEVHTGTFRLVETEAGLAALLGHELAHALAGDTTPLTPPCFGPDDQPRSLPSYQEELDADSAGLSLMADAGYDPRELLRLWDRMRMERRELDRLHTHVTFERRMAQIAQRLPAAIMHYERTNRAPQIKLPSRESPRESH